MIDNIPRVIDQAFLWGIKGGIHDILVDGLGLAEDGSRSKAEAYLAESGTVTQKREYLKQAKKRFEEIHSALQNFIM